MQVSISEAKTSFSKLIRLLETHKEESITIAKNGRPVAMLSLIPETPVSKRIGVGKNKFTILGDFDTDNKAIADALSEDLL